MRTCLAGAILVVLASWTAPLTAQDCSIPFTQPLFAVQTERDMVYGEATRFDGGTDTLRLNLFKPVGDGQTERPLLVMVHGGGFTGGRYRDMDDLCSIIASMGWAVATIGYRLGYHGTDLHGPPYAYDPAEPVRASYRAMQDTKGAIRFLKGRHEEDSTSTTNVMLLGFSAGAITALHTAYLDRPEERPGASHDQAPAQLSSGTWPRPDLGDIDGTLNQNGMDASVLGVVNVFGALLDTSYIETASDPALYSYHQEMDPIVGCGHQRPYWEDVSGASDNHPVLFGSCAIDIRMRSLGFSEGRYHATIHDGDEHGIHAPLDLLGSSMQWLRGLFCTSTGTVERPVSTEVRAYPNPTTGMLTVERPGHGTSPYELRDAMGRLVRTGMLSDGLHTLDLGPLPEGLYMLRTTVEGHGATVRLVLAR